MRTFLEYIDDLEYHAELNPRLWDGDHLKPDVRVHLLAIAEKWKESTKVTETSVKDIIITGGNCNFNYSHLSDIDLHVIVSYQDLDAFLNLDVFKDYVKAKKDNWEAKHNITIAGYPVEVYLQDISEKFHTNQGVYSLVSDKWLQKPIHLNPDFYDDPELIRKIKNTTHSIESAIKRNASVDIASALKDSITSARGPAVNKDGEFARDNLTFKALRNAGYIQKLTDYIRNKEDRELSY